MKLPIAVVTGLDRHANLSVAREMLGHAREALVVHCLDHADLGLVSRTVEFSTGQTDAEVVDLAHGCATCTMREDLLPTLVALAQTGQVDRTVVVLPESTMPSELLHMFAATTLDDGTSVAELCEITSVVGVVQADWLIAQFQCDETLIEHGLSPIADDLVADVVVDVVNAASHFVVFGAEPDACALLRLLNPDAGTSLATKDGLQTIALPRHPFSVTTAIERCDPAAVPTLDGINRDADAWQFQWRADRPLHPKRLAEVLSELVNSTLRIHGTVVLASAPTRIVNWDSTGARVYLAPGDAGLTTMCCNLRVVGVAGDPLAVSRRLDATVASLAEAARDPLWWQFDGDPFAELWESIDIEEAS